jgi:hypothetical protein
VTRGFSIANRTPANSTEFSTYNLTSSGRDLIFANFDPGNDILWALFIFRTILVILASYFGVGWMSAIDQSIRFSQPFANMYKKHAKAEDSILLDYL